MSYDDKTDSHDEPLKLPSLNSVIKSKKEKVNNRDDEENIDEKAQEIIDQLIKEQNEKNEADNEEDDSYSEPQKDEDLMEGPVTRTTPKLRKEAPVKNKEDDKEQKEDYPLKSKFSDFMAKVKAELHGEDSSNVKASKDDDLPDYAKPLPVDKDSDDDLEDNNENDNENKKDDKKNKKNDKKGFFSKISSIYIKISDFILKIITSFLGFLSKIPLIGRLFRLLSSFSMVWKIIARLFPLVVVLLIFFAIWNSSVPKNQPIEMPDNGSAVIEKTTYSNGRIKATIHNTGDIIVNVKPTFTIWTNQISINPKSWVVPEKSLTCSSDYVPIDIGNEKTIDIQCGQANGILPRVSGTLESDE